jgi:transcriptional regulator with XRE-family HTH domain/mannose-6-phosphate isomerase-like protein (cupin superfamily)
LSAQDHGWNDRSTESARSCTVVINRIEFNEHAEGAFVYPEAVSKDPGSERDLGLARTGRSPVDGLGSRLRAERTRAGLTLRQFARLLDVSASFVSQIETGKSQPSVATLYQISQALNLPIEELFADRANGTGPADSPGPDTALAAQAGAAQDQGASVARARPARHSPVVSPDERRRLVFDSGVTWEKLSAENSDPSVDFLYVRYDPGGSSTSDGQVMRHAGVEYGYVLKGTLEVTLGFESHEVGPQQSISFDSSLPHRLVNRGTEPVEAVWFVHGRDAAHDH